MFRKKWIYYTKTVLSPVFFNIRFRQFSEIIIDHTKTLENTNLDKENQLQFKKNNTIKILDYMKEIEKIDYITDNTVQYKIEKYINGMKSSSELLSFMIDTIEQHNLCQSVDLLGIVIDKMQERLKLEKIDRKVAKIKHEIDYNRLKQFLSFIQENKLHIKYSVQIDTLMYANNISDSKRKNYHFEVLLRDFISKIEKNLVENLDLVAFEDLNKALYLFVLQKQNTKPIIRSMLEKLRSNDFETKHSYQSWWLSTLRSIYLISDPMREISKRKISSGSSNYLILKHITQLCFKHLNKDIRLKINNKDKMNQIKIYLHTSIICHSLGLSSTKLVTSTIEIIQKAISKQENINNLTEHQKMSIIKAYTSVPTSDKVLYDILCKEILEDLVTNKNLVNRLNSKKFGLKYLIQFLEIQMNIKDRIQILSNSDKLHVFRAITIVLKQSLSEAKSITTYIKIYFEIFDNLITENFIKSKNELNIELIDNIQKIVDNIDVQSENCKFTPMMLSVCLKKDINVSKKFEKWMQLNSNARKSYKFTDLKLLENFYILNLFILKKSSQHGISQELLYDTNQELEDTYFAIYDSIKENESFKAEIFQALLTNMDYKNMHTDKFYRLKTYVFENFIGVQNCLSTHDQIMVIWSTAMDLKYNTQNIEFSELFEKFIFEKSDYEIFIIKIIEVFVSLENKSEQRNSPCLTGFLTKILQKMIKKWPYTSENFEQNLEEIQKKCKTYTKIMVLFINGISTKSYIKDIKTGEITGIHGQFINEFEDFLLGYFDNIKNLNLEKFQKEVSDHNQDDEIEQNQEALLSGSFDLLKKLRPTAKIIRIYQ